MLFFIEARVTRHHVGLSSPRQEVIGKLVNANNANEAEMKYQRAVRNKYANEGELKLHFEYLHFADEIK
ncbi:MAG TPA: hypothetical protein PL028_09355 [Bacteroidales bacterium]|jgi:hypothetical protein|nr:hypothetical protein [Bacteroidales bacterium]